MLHFSPSPIVATGILSLLNHQNNDNRTVCALFPNCLQSPEYNAARSPENNRFFKTYVWLGYSHVLKSFCKPLVSSILLSVFFYLGLGGGGTLA